MNIKNKKIEAILIVITVTHSLQGPDFFGIALSVIPLCLPHRKEIEEIATILEVIYSLQDLGSNTVLSIILFCLAHGKEIGDVLGVFGDIGLIPEYRHSRISFVSFFTSWYYMNSLVFSSYWNWDISMKTSGS
jgi:hypothetical protein